MLEISQLWEQYKLKVLTNSTCETAENSWCTEQLYAVHDSVVHSSTEAVDNAKTLA